MREEPRRSTAPPRRPLYPRTPHNRRRRRACTVAGERHRRHRAGLAGGTAGAGDGRGARPRHGLCRAHRHEPRRSIHPAGAPARRAILGAGAPRGVRARRAWRRRAHHRGTPLGGFRAACGRVATVGGCRARRYRRRARYAHRWQHPHRTGADRRPPVPRSQRCRPRRPQSLGRPATRPRRPALDRHRHPGRWRPGPESAARR